ncbi:uncharacterized protein LOC117643822 [Thrips palmi]|uniref:Gustatory receptor n=1 Tax=Thrips palmi TaxID=161013 RepID=A0A6P8YNP9_THRPL|nr:uncharacterized protein LOC117643822 [Thrips palmi]
MSMMRSRRLCWLARVLGVFPLTERPAGEPVKPDAKINAVFPADAASAMPRSWTTDFSRKARGDPGPKPMLLERSAFWTCYSVLFVSVVLCATVYCTLDDFFKGEAATGVRWTSRTDQYATLCEYLSLCISALASAISACAFVGPVIRQADLLAEVDALLGLPPPAPHRFLSLWLFVVLGVIVTDSSVWLVTGSNTVFDALEDLPLYVTYYMCFTSEVLFMSDALAVKERIASVNEILVSAMPPPGTLCVRRLAKAHAMLCEAMEAVSTRYGPPLAVDMVGVLLNLVITSYFSLEDLLPFSPPGDDGTLTFMEMVFAMLHLGRIVMLVEPGSSANREAERSAVLVGYLCSTVPHGSLMYEQLKAMSTQLHHQRPAFTHCGVIELDRSLIVSIVGSVTTYLLVLLQLKPTAIHDSHTNSTA